MDHGGARNDELNLLDFSYSSNPYKPPFMKEVLKEARLDRYPYCEESLEQRIIENYGIKGDVAIAAGITEQLYIIFNIFKKHRFLIPRYSYGEYSRVANIIGVKFKTIDSKDPEMNDFKATGGDVIIINNPNNPTGKYYDYVPDLVDEAEKKNYFVIVDEAFIDFVGPKVKNVKVNNNTIILRSFSKSFNVSGIRTGFSIANEYFAREIRNMRMPWGVGAIGCSLIDSILKDNNFLQSSLVKIFKERERIQRRMGLRTDANFFIASVGNGSKVKEVLKQKGILVRDCSSFGFPDSIRFSIRNMHDNNKILNELEKFEVKIPDGIKY